MIHLSQIRRHLDAHRPATHDRPAPRGRAAVAIVLSGEVDGLALCLIRRAERAGDPWSGHIALPGGRIGRDDETPRAAAERETREEVGLVLHPAMYLGALSELAVRIAGHEIGMTLAPFVFYAGTDMPPLATSDEVAESYWTPLADLWGDEYRSTLQVARAGTHVAYPSVRVGAHHLWGLTYRVLTDFGAVIGAPFGAGEGTP